MSTGTICLLISAGIMIIVTIYLDIVGEQVAEIKEIAQSYGWADMDKVRKLDGKRYEPAPATMDAQYFTMPDGTPIRRR